MDFSNLKTLPGQWVDAGRKVVGNVSDRINSQVADIKEGYSRAKKNVDDIIELQKKLQERIARERLARLNELGGRQLKGKYESLLSTKPINKEGVPEIRFTPNGSSTRYTLPESIIPGVKAGYDFSDTLDKIKKAEGSDSIMSPTVREVMTARTGDPTYFDQYMKHLRELPSGRYGDVEIRPFPSILYSNPELFANKRYPMVYSDKFPADAALTFTWPIIRKAYVGTGPYSKLSRINDNKKLKTFDQGVTSNHLEHALDYPNKKSQVGNFALHELTHDAQADELSPVRMAVTYGSGMDENDSRAQNFLDDYSVIPRERAQAMSAFNQQRYKLANEIRKNRGRFLVNPDGKPTGLTNAQLDTIINMPTFFKPRNGKYEDFDKAMKFFHENPGAAHLLHGEGTRFITNYGQLMDQIAEKEKEIQRLKARGQFTGWDEMQLKSLKDIQRKYRENSILGNLKNHNRSGVSIG